MKKFILFLFFLFPINSQATTFFPNVSALASATPSAPGQDFFISTPTPGVSSNWVWNGLEYQRFNTTAGINTPTPTITNTFTLSPTPTGTFYTPTFTPTFSPTPTWTATPTCTCNTANTPACSNQYTATPTQTLNSDYKRQYHTYYPVGDSFTAGTGAIPTGMRYSDYLWHATGSNQINIGWGNSVILDEAVSQMILQQTGINDLTTIYEGYNDASANGDVVPSVYKPCLEQMILTGAIPYANLVLPAFNPAVTLVGDWGGSFYNPPVINQDTVWTQEDGDTVTTTLYGTSIYFAYAWGYYTNSFGGADSVTIDGVGQADVTQSGNYNSFHEGEGTYVTIGGNFVPFVARYSGLNPGPHVITITAHPGNEGGYSTVLWFASNNNVGYPGAPTVRVFSMNRGINQHSGTPLGLPYFNNNWALDYNAVIQQAVSEIKSDGFDVDYANIDNFFTPQLGQESPDYTHPNNKGYFNIASGGLSKIPNGQNPGIIAVPTVTTLYTLSTSFSSTGSGNYTTGSGNAVTLSAGTWSLNGACAFSANGGDPVYTALNFGWYASNGGNSGSAPATLVTKTGNPGALLGVPAFNTTSGIGGLTGAELANPILISTSSPVTVFLVPFPSYTGSAGNTKFNTEIQATLISTATN